MAKTKKAVKQAAKKVPAFMKKSAKSAKGGKACK
jgi:hypothetical protein